MVKFGAHAFVWTGNWTAQSGDEVIAQAAEAGFDFLEIPLLEPESFEATRHRRTLEEVGIEATCSLVLPEHAHMPERPEVAKAFLLLALDKVVALGARYLCGCLAYHLGHLTGAPPTEDERATVVRVLREVAAEADARGVTLALEACNRYETYLYNTLADARATIVEVGAPNLKLHADTYHMNIEEEGFREPIVATADVLDYIHMSESHRGALSTGTVNWAEVWAGLAQIDFSGSLVLESFAAINPTLAAATCVWRPPNEPSEAIARDGLAFLKEGAKKCGLL